MVRKTVLYVLASGPILLLGLIAINSRYKVNGWEFIEYSPETSARIETYVGPITASRAHFRSDEHKRCSASCPGVDTWLAAKWSGLLKDVHPPTSFVDDNSTIYWQIIKEKNHVMSEANKIALRLEEKGFKSEAAFAYMDMLDIADVAKYSEFGSLIESSVSQVSTLEKIRRLVPSLSDEDRAHLIERMTALDSPARSLSVTADKMAGAYRMDQSRSRHYTVTYEAAQTGSLLASAGDEGKDRIDSLQRMIGTDASALALYSQSQLAYIQERRFSSALQNLRVALIPPVSSN